MRKNVLLFLAALAFFVLPCCVSCTEPANEDNKDDNEQTQNPEPEKLTVKPGTYKFTAPPLKGKWEAGDKIYVHGNYAPAAQVVTLKAQDISDDGLTASAELDRVTEYPCAPDGLFAAWPAEAVKEDDGLQDNSTWFSSGLYSLLAVAYLKEDTFTFIDASCLLSFSVTGDFDCYAIASNTREGLRLKEFQASHSSDETIMARNTDGYPFRYGELKSGETVTICFPGIIKFKKGYTIFFGKGGKYTHCYTVEDAFNLKYGEKKELGDITANVTTYDGPAPKMPEMGKMTSTKVKISNLSGLCHSKDFEFLWAVGNDGTLGKIGYDGILIPQDNGKDVVSIGGDAEGVTLDPETGHIYFAWEAYTVGIVRAPDYNKGEAFFKIHEALRYGNSGMEGITYYKDGLIYCGTQTGANLFLCDLNAQLDEKMYTPIIWVKSLQEMYPGIIDEVGGLYYDPLTDWLWLTDSNYKKISVFTGDAEMLLGSYSVPIGNAESVCVDHKNSCLWVGHDSDSSTSTLFRFEFTGLDDAIINQ